MYRFLPFFTCVSTYVYPVCSGGVTYTRIYFILFRIVNKSDFFIFPYKWRRKKGKHTHFIICLQWFIYKIIQILMSCLFCFKLYSCCFITTRPFYEWYLFSCPSLYKLYNETIHNCLLLYLLTFIQQYKEIFIINKVFSDIFYTGARGFWCYDPQ